MRTNKRPIYTADLETDPFLYGRKPLPFLAGVYDGSKSWNYWGADVIHRLSEYLYNLPPGIIYFHNGGRFDVLGYMMHLVIGNPMRVINNRIVKARMKCAKGWHEIRDSYAILPVPLSKMKGKRQKKEIAISKLESSEIWNIETKEQTTSRELYREEITEYLDYDCLSLFDYVTEFIERYGLELTIGTTAMKQLKQRHSFETLSENDDALIRSQYFYGGRVDVLQPGISRGNFKLYDVNSMYPNAMAHFRHPISGSYDITREISDHTFFVTAEGFNYRAFPVRRKGGGLDYTQGYGTFSVSIHEWNMAAKYGLFEPVSIKHCIDFQASETFSEFVYDLYDGKQQAKLDGRAAEELFFKTLLNSGYGKFAQSPDNYMDYMVTLPEVCPGAEWTLSTMVDMTGEYEHQFWIWTKPSINKTRFNVATGASITGAARSVLMEAIAVAERPIYCDTDSLLCESLPLELHDSKLGAWKLEAEVDLAAVAGKKLYAFYQNGKCVKKAHKGFKITGADILKVCQGKRVQSFNDAPTFKLDGTTSFVTRQVRMTV